MCIRYPPIRHLSTQSVVVHTESYTYLKIVGKRAVERCGDQRSERDFGLASRSPASQVGYMQLQASCKSGRELHQTRLTSSPQPRFRDTCIKT